MLRSQPLPLERSHQGPSVHELLKFFSMLWHDGVLLRLLFVLVGRDVYEYCRCRHQQQQHRGPAASRYDDRHARRLLVPYSYLSPCSYYYEYLYEYECFLRFATLCNSITVQDLEEQKRTSTTGPRNI